jgi:hypothetical protein
LVEKKKKTDKEKESRGGKREKRKEENKMGKVCAYSWLKFCRSLVQKKIS